ncbi:GIY-YIG nuclease family protein [Acaryochloris marina]|uniref:GIY-YIG domain-containing protein n=1 Tax=Acaryochloris marina (strain MBIC 11017) TaxID=329726 RepID=A8ZNJ4_ACAM1|nr:GIY-YIG nuclease family protein [Acaryochloris marina]ABW32580.1 hypothetical protein AM1_D0085 [Acaryochloris marina MBIC11017]
MRFTTAKSLINLDPLPEICGIYFVVTAEDEIIYVGQTTNLKNRWKDGHKVLKRMLAEGIDPTKARLEWQKFPKRLLNRVENCAVRVHQPRLNEKSPPVL